MSETRIVDTKTLLKELGISQSSLSNYIAKGMPVVKLDPKGNRYDVEACREYANAKGWGKPGSPLKRKDSPLRPKVDEKSGAAAETDLEKEKIRNTKADADTKEYKLDIIKGRFIRAKEVDRELIKIGDWFKQRFNTLHQLIPTDPETKEKIRLATNALLNDAVERLVRVRAKVVKRQKDRELAKLDKGASEANNE